MKIKDLCVDERPREKMLVKGASSLSNAELIAILLRTGTEKRNALEIAQMLLNMAEGSLTKASRMSVDELCRIGGIGPERPSPSGLPSNSGNGYVQRSRTKRRT